MFNETTYSRATKCYLNRFYDIFDNTIMTVIRGFSDTTQVEGISSKMSKIFELYKIEKWQANNEWISKKNRSTFRNLKSKNPESPNFNFFR